MEHILINSGKLKLMLSREDIERYELSDVVGNGNNYPEGTSEQRMALRKLLDDAERIPGFDGGQGRLFVQLYPSRDGGAEVYITRLTKEPCATVGFRKDGDVMKITKTGVFDELSDLIGCCRALSGLGAEHGGRIMSDSSAFSDGRRYFLVLSGTISCREYLDGVSSRRIEAVIGEFGETLTVCTRKLIYASTVRAYVRRALSGFFRICYNRCILFPGQYENCRLLGVECCGKMWYNIR